MVISCALFSFICLKTNCSVCHVYCLALSAIACIEHNLIISSIPFGHILWAPYGVRSVYVNFVLNNEQVQHEINLMGLIIMFK